MPDNRMNITLQVTDKATAELAKVKTKLQQFTTSFKQNWLAATAAITASIFAIQKAWDILETSAKAKQQAEAFENMARSMHFNSQQIISDLKKMSGNTMDTAEVITKASQAIILGLDPNKLAKMMEISRASARAFGKDVGFMFESIALGVGRQSRMILDNLGIIVRAEDAYEAYAKELGKTKDELTGAEKQQAFLNATLEAGEEIIRKVNVGLKSELEYMQSLKAWASEMKVTLGDWLWTFIKGFTSFLNALRSGFAQVIESIFYFREISLEALLNVARGIDKISSHIPFLRDKVQSVSETLEQWKIEAGATRLEFDKLGEDFAMTSVEIASLIGENITPALQSMVNVEEEAGNAAKDAAKTAKKEWKDFAKDTVSALGTLQSALAGAEEFGKGFAKAAAAVSLGLAIINTAQGVTKAFADYSWPFSMVVAGIIAAAGAIQIATIAATKFHKGGIIRAHDGLAVDEVPIIAQTGEGVLSRRGMRTIGGASSLDRLNSGRAMGNQIHIEINNPLVNSMENIDALVEAISYRLNLAMERA